MFLDSHALRHLEHRHASRRPRKRGDGSLRMVNKAVGFSLQPHITTKGNTSFPQEITSASMISATRRQPAEDPAGAEAGSPVGYGTALS